MATFIALAVPRIQADLFVSSQTSPTANTILRYDDATGAFLGVFASGGGLADPLGITFGPDGNLYVASAQNGQVLRYDGRTGVFLGVFASGGGLQAPINMTFGPDGNLYVSSCCSQVLRYNGHTGAFIDVFISGGALAYPRGLKFGPDGNLYVVNFITNTVLRYNGTTGVFIDTFVPSGSGGLFTANDLVFGPDGNLYVSGSGVFRYNGSTGEFIDQFTSFYDRGSPIDLAFGPDCNLYVVSQAATFAVVRINGQTGAIEGFISSGSGGVSNPFGLVFSPAVRDSVCDGIPDSWRAQYFANQPTNNANGTMTNGQSCATCDADGTGQDNLLKYLIGLDPTNPASVFRIMSLVQQGNDIAVSWQAGGGRTNLVQTANSMVTSNNFNDISPAFILPGSGNVFTNWIDTGGASNSPTRFYRIRLGP